MWAEFLQLPNRYVAETWRDLLHAEGIAVPPHRPAPERAAEGDLAPRTLLVPDSKTHVAREILRKV